MYAFPPCVAKTKVGTVKTDDSDLLGYPQIVHLFIGFSMKFSPSILGGVPTIFGSTSIIMYIYIYIIYSIYNPTSLLG